MWAFDYVSIRSYMMAERRRREGGQPAAGGNAGSALLFAMGHQRPGRLGDAPRAVRDLDFDMDRRVGNGDNQAIHLERHLRRASEAGR